MTDPIAELARDLASNRKPTLAWVIRWSADGDPVAAAWKESERPMTMLRLGWPHWSPETREAAARVAVDTCSGLSRTKLESIARSIRVGRNGPWFPVHIYNTLFEAIDDGRAHAWRMCAAIRRVVPVPPTLTELLTASAAVAR